MYCSVPPGSRSLTLLLAALLVGALGCGSGMEGLEPEAEGCSSDADCAADPLCLGSTCQAPPLVVVAPVREQACSVVSCPGEAPGCCMAAAASATGNQTQSFTPQLHLVQRVRPWGRDIRADFVFEEADQQGWLVFELGSEIELSRLRFSGRRTGVADRFVSVHTTQQDAGGCAFTIELASRPEPFPRGEEVALMRDDFCYGGGSPGRASELAFAIFSTSPGEGSLIISSIDMD